MKLLQLFNRGVLRYQLRTMASDKPAGPIQMAIQKALSTNLEPIHLEVRNESYMHSVPPDSETHFKVLVVSPKFDGLTLIKRHRMVNDLVKQELGGQFVHALSIEAKTAAQWSPDYTLEPSPNCRGGFGK